MTRGELVKKIYIAQRSTSILRGYNPPEYSLYELRHWMLSQNNFFILYKDWLNSGNETSLIPSIDRLNDYTGYSIDNIRLTTWGENRSKLFRDKRSGKNNKVSKAVIQLDMDGNEVNRFYSLSQASRALIGKDNGGSKIGEVCSGKRKTMYGYKWKFEIPHLTT